MPQRSILRAGALVLGLAVALSTGACTSYDGTDTDISTSAPSESSWGQTLAFTVNLAGGPRNYENCDIAFTELMKTSPDSMHESERASSVQECSTNSSFDDMMK